MPEAPPAAAPADSLDQGTRYRRSRAGILTVMFFAASVCGLLPAGGLAGTLTEHMDVMCAQDPVDFLSCSYRLRDGHDLISAVVEYDGQAIPGEQVNGYPHADATTAVMILVDTSDPARQPAIASAISHIEQLLAGAKPHHRFGLASFDTDLYVLAEVGTTLQDLRGAAANLRAKGKTTELYRNVREAVRLLGKTNATRKALWILSDGLAEDYAYHHQDVVALARSENVIIHSIGYPRSVQQSVALQTIRRLSDETGGHYVQANHVDYSIPAGTFGRALRATDSGADVQFDLSELLGAGVGGAVDLSLGFQTTDQSLIVLVPIHLPGGHGASQNAVLPGSGERADANRLSQSAFVPPPLAPLVPPSRPLWPWFAALIALLLVILIVILIAFKRVRRSIADSPMAAMKDSKPLAYIVMHDKNQTRHAVDKTPWRIGRGRNNDLTIADHSVSRLHAEIRSNEEGQLMLCDLESLNGVFVNDNRIEATQLREGDSVEIGDIGMHFTLHDESYATEDPTVMVRTRTPV